MAARCLKLVAIGAFVGVPLLACASYGSEPAESGHSVVDYLSEVARTEMDFLDREIERCSELAADRQVGQDEAMVELQRRFGRELMVSALGHLHFRNQLNCELSARQSLSYTLATLVNAAGDDKALAGDIADYPKSLLYPSERELAYEVRYQTLPQDLTEALESILGTEPFDLLSALDIEG